ncbi:hypothetical protein WJX84_009701 [Apatococcus fuscideae]|uniref:Chloride channel protein n=1 Tax=Apatococcus fuscideae TaxID=2026836 RepID=A0AAW1SSG8_9CHLO
MNPLLNAPLVPFPEDQEGSAPHFEPFGLGYQEEDVRSTSGASELLPDGQVSEDGGFLDWLFKRNAGLENCGTNHQYTREERDKLNLCESIDYLPPNSAVYRTWLARQPHRRKWDRWFMMGSIGVVVGGIGFMLATLIALLSSFKYLAVRYLLTHTDLGVAWLFNMLFSIGLVVLATWTVVKLAPEAAGGGVAEVMAYLNGCQLPKVFNVRTLLVKFVSCAAAVGSGLPVGPEGPMIHIGAMVGAALSQGHSTTLNFSTSFFQRFRNPRDKRDFVTAGTAVGVATAFGAPIGGLLFAFEELAASFSQALGWQIFFACMLAVLVSDTLRSAQRAALGGEFGIFEGAASTIIYEVQMQLKNHVAAVAPAALIGALCGLLGGAFTAVNLKIARLRAAATPARTGRMWMMVEPCVLIGLFVTFGMLLPLAFPCRPTQCYMRPGEDVPICPEGTPDHLQRIVEESIELYTCKESAYDSEIPADSQNSTVPRSYNELATLMSVTGEDAIRHLLSRGTHREFGYAALLVMLVFYFGGAAWAAGSAVASGLFVPMLLIGACIGRLVGLAAVDVAAASHNGSPGAPPGVFLNPSAWAWLDPGAFALIGAGAFMGGVTRLTISLAVIMMEVSSDVRMLLPLLVGIMVAKWVADALTHPLYHGLLEIKCIPFLNPEPMASKHLDLLPVARVMASPVVTLCERDRLGTVWEALRHTNHNGFPVVRASAHGQVFAGLVTRDHLLVLLRQALSMPQSGAAPAVMPYEALRRNPLADRRRAAALDPLLHISQVVKGWSGPGGEAGALALMLNLGPYVNTSAPSVQSSFSVERAHMLFRSLGLRHLTVVDAHNRVRGIITRKDLLGYKLDEAWDRVDGNVSLAASVAASSASDLREQYHL